MKLTCPTCSAKNTESIGCRRCGTDFTLITAASTASNRLLGQAAAACRNQENVKMLRLAGRALRLCRTPDALRMAACAALLNRQYREALSLWRETTAAAGND